MLSLVTTRITDTDSVIQSDHGRGDPDGDERGNPTPQAAGQRKSSISGPCSAQRYDFSKISVLSTSRRFWSSRSLNFFGRSAGLDSIRWRRHGRCWWCCWPQRRRLRRRRPRRQRSSGRPRTTGG